MSRERGPPRQLVSPLAARLPCFTADHGNGPTGGGSNAAENAFKRIAEAQSMIYDCCAVPPLGSATLFSNTSGHKNAPPTRRMMTLNLLPPPNLVAIIQTYGAA